MATSTSSRLNLKKNRSYLLAEEKEYVDSHVGEKEYGEGQIFRKRTVTEYEVLKRKDSAHEAVSHLESKVQHYVPEILENAIFCGHLVTDLDSIAGAIGAAELYGLNSSNRMIC